MKPISPFTQGQSDHQQVIRAGTARVFALLQRIVLLLCIVTPALLLAQITGDALFDAARDGDVQKVEANLDGKTKINTRNPAGRTPLMIAAMNGHAELVKLLLDRGADLQLLDEKGQTARQLANEFGQVEIVKLLDQVAAAADPQVAFYTAVKKGDLQAAQTALRNGADVNAPTGLGVTALMMAAGNGNHPMLKFLLEENATVNATDNEGRTAFDYADLPGHPVDEQAQLILKEKGAITNQYDAQFLNEKLRDSVRAGDADRVYAALAKKADPNYDGKDGSPETILMIAAESGNLEMVKAILKAGANPNRTTAGNGFWQGKTALFLAAAAGQTAIVSVLIENGAKVDVKQPASGYTPLILASMGGFPDTVKLLIEHGADPNAKDSNGRTAFAVADGTRRSEIQQILTKAGAIGQVTPVDQRPVTGQVSKVSNPTKVVQKVDSKKLTKSEWKKSYYSQFPVGSIVTVANFRGVFGEPSREQTVESDAHWYFECKDGTIQVVLNDPNQFGGGACVQSINDY